MSFSRGNKFSCIKEEETYRFFEKVYAKDTNKIFNDDICNQYGSQEQIQNLRNFSKDLMILIERRNQMKCY